MCENFYTTLEAQLEADLRMRMLMEMLTRAGVLIDVKHKVLHHAETDLNVTLPRNPFMFDEL